MTEHFGDLLLELYAATRELPEPDFAPYALGLSRALLGFDAARITALEWRGAELTLRRYGLYREAAEQVLQWCAVAGADRMLQACRARPGTAVRFHAGEAAASPGPRHVVGLLAADGGDQYECYAFYRDAERRPYSEQERRDVQTLVPHLREALRLNRLLGRAGGLGADSRLAIATPDGALHYCGEDFAGLLRIEWPDWNGASLPTPLMARLTAVGGRGYMGRQLQVTAQPAGSRLILRARKGFRLDQLAPREREVARLYGAGQSYKEIAQMLALAPSTVRNLVQRVYQKLAVVNKVQLAGVMAADSPR